jgi:predicted TPR repeat methyltransferase
MTDKTFDPKLWTDRSPEETRALYTDWAATYDADVTGRATPRPPGWPRRWRPMSPTATAPVLDFGCGTGLSGRR